MPDNVYQFASFEAVHSMFTANSDWASIAVEYAAKLDSRFWTKSWQDVVYQSRIDSRATVYEAMGFALVHSMICSGEIRILRRRRWLYLLERINRSALKTHGFHS